MAPTGGRILVVDDHEDNRDLMQQDLEDRGFQVALAKDGPEALALARDWEPEVILMDLAMPGMDGIQTCRKLKDDPALSHIPVVFLTAERAGDSTTVNALRAGGTDFLQKPYSSSVLEARLQGQVGLFRSNQALQRTAMTDELTGLFSRRYLFTSLQQQVRLGSRASTDLALLLVDVDHFKSVNDQFGHVEGDRVLQALGRVFNESLRGSDLAARFGGEEFVVLLPHTSLEQAVKVAEQLRARVQEKVTVPRPVTVSVGVAVHPAEDKRLTAAEYEDRVQSLIKRADAALYRAKAEGRNRVSVNPS